MLCTPRCHDSPEEKAFTGWLQTYIVKDLKHVITEREAGSFSVTIPLAECDTVANTPTIYSTTLFSCHVDTVDGKMLDPASRKKLTYDPVFGTIALDSSGVGNCLGADDTAGIWLMLKMIEAGCPGTYLFHRGEECGGVSAKANADKIAGWLRQFQCAVAFDRKDTGDIVTVQGGMRCASSKFTHRLGDMLAKHGFDYKESTTGTYTDVKDYRKLIPEVVNLSCGYDMAHTRGETLDYAHLFAMSQALPKIEWEALPIDRDPAAKDPVPSYKGAAFKGSRFAGMDDLFDDDDLKRQWGKQKKANGAKPAAKPTAKPGEKTATLLGFDNPFHGMTFAEIEDATYSDSVWAVEGIVWLMRENARLQADNEMLAKLMGL
jgi:hypothetical protein